MLGLAQFQHKIDSNKKKIYSVTLMVLLVFSGLMGAFISFPHTRVKADSTYVYTEEFDDDSLGAATFSNPSEYWYSLNCYDATADDWGEDQLYWVNVSNNRYVSSYYSLWLNFNDYGATPASMRLAFNLTNAAVIDYINYSFYMVNTYKNQYTLFLGNANNSQVIRIIWSNSIATNEGMWVRQNGSYSYTGLDENNIGLGSWCWVNITFDWTGAHKWSNISFYNGASVNNFNYWMNDQAEENIDLIQFLRIGGYYCYMNIDNMRIGSPTEIGEVGDYPYINPTSFNNSLPTIKSGHHCLTFDNNSGTPAWSNNTGESHETMNITIVDGNVSVNFVNISIFNLTDGSGHYIDADRLSLYVYNSSSLTWVNISNFPTGGGNITLDSSITTIGVTWPISGDQTILCRFKFDIPLGIETEIYTITGCKVWIGG